VVWTAGTRSVVVRHAATTCRSKRPEAGPARLRDLSGRQALREAKLTALTSAVDDQAVGALLALPEPAPRARPDCSRPPCVARVDARPGPGSHAAGDRGGLVPGGTAGGPAVSGRGAPGRRRRPPGPAELPVFRPRTPFAGLLHLLRDEPRLQTSWSGNSDRRLDAQHPREQLLGTLRAYLDQGRNKSAGAAAAHLSRPAFYERLARIGRILDADLDSVESCLSLHVALLALDAVRDS
jgi:purine catabolism regulator